MKMKCVNTGIEPRAVFRTTQKVFAVIMIVCEEPRVVPALHVLDIQ